MAAKSTRKQSGLIIGRKGFARISEVEDMALSKDAKADFRRFDRDNLSPEARRRAIIEKYAKARP